MSLTDWEEGVMVARAVRELAARLISAAEYSSTKVEARHGLEAFAKVIEKADPPLPRHQLSALLKLMGLGVDQLLSGAG